jgi:hypothetical protein
VTRGVLPLTDDFPKRLDDDADESHVGVGHLPWMDTRLTRERFRTSEFIRRTWPPDMRRRTLPYFAYQRMIDEARGFQQRGPVHRGDRVRNIHAALTEGGLHVLPLWWLGVDEDQLRAMDRHLAKGGEEEAHPFRLGSRALADGDFDRAAAYFERVPSSVYDEKLILFLRLYALCMADLVDEAEDLARRRLASIRLDRRDRAFLDWLTATFGFTLRALG